MKGLAWTLALPLAVVGLIVVFTDWVEWPWWAGLLLGTPAGLMAVWEIARGESLSGGDWSPGSDLGGDGGGGGDGG